MSVDILAIGENNKKKQAQQQVLPAWQKKQQFQETPIESPIQKARDSLDRQVEIGLGSKIGNLLSKKEKQIYADGLSDKNWNLMQRYKAEGYSFEASKTLVENQKKLVDPYASGINKYDNYEMKENYYNKNGVQIDPESNIGKLATFMQKIGFNDTYGNPLNQLAQQYNERYATERDTMDYLIENEELNLLQRFGWWLEKGLLTAESGIISGLGKIGNAVGGVGDINSSAIDATLDRALLGLDTDLNYYREEDRRLDEYLWEGVSGGLNTIFWAWAPKVMTMFSYIGETKAGGTALEFADNLVRGTIQRGLENGLGFYYNGLDEQGKEDMLDTLTTLAYMEIAKKTNKRTGKLKTTKIGIEYNSLKNQFRNAFKEGWKGAKQQVGREVSNVKNATDLYGENGTKIGKTGPEGQVGVGDSISRVVQAGVNNFKQSFVDRLNARHGGTIAEPGTVETPTAGTGKPTDTPTTEKGTVGKATDLAKSIWDTTITGLTPEERIRIQNDPFTIEKWEKAKQMLEEAGMPLEDSFITEQLYNEIGENIKAVFEEWENKLGDTSPYYGEIRKNTNRYNLVESLPQVYNVLAENDIVRDPISGDLDFTNSKFVSDSDMRSVQRAVNMIEKALILPLAPREYLNLRDKLKQLASYTTVDASRGQSLIRQLRHTVNEIAHKQIPGLKDLDKVTSKYFKEIEELKEGWVYKGGDRKGEIRNNFYSIIKNLTGQNRKVMLDRLEKYYPGIGEEIEAIHIVNKIVKAYNKSPQMVKGLGVGLRVGGVIGGKGLLGGLIGAIMGEMINKGLIEPLTKSRRKAAIDKLLSKMSPEAKRKLEAIAKRQLTAKELSAEDQAILDKVAEIIKQEREKGLSNLALKSWAGYTMEKNGSKRDIKPYGDYLYDITEQPLKKFNGTLTNEQKKLGLDTYKIASLELDGWDIESDNEIIAARGKFMLMNQKPGYTKALGLDQGEVNQKIVSRWKDNQGPKPELVKFMEEVWGDELPENRYTGIAANFTKDNPYQNRGIDAIDFLAGDVKTAEDPTQVNYNPRIDDTIETLLFTNSHLNHGSDKIRFTNGISENRYSELLRNDEANGEFFSDSLLLIGGQGDNTMKHELGHEGDAVFGIEIFGVDWLRSKGVSEFVATSSKARRFLEKYGNLEKDSPYKSKEVVEFHKRLLNFVDSLKPTDWMLKDKTIIDGNPASEYWSMPEEKLARFWAQAIQEIKRMNTMGVGPRKTFRGLIGTRLGDEYTSDQLKEFLKLLQMHQKLAAKGMFYDVEPISKSDINLKTGLRDYTPKKLTPEEQEKRAANMVETRENNTKGFNNELMIKEYHPDIDLRQENVEKVLGKGHSYSEHGFIDYALTLKAMSKDPDFMKGLEMRADWLQKYGSSIISQLAYMLSKMSFDFEKGGKKLEIKNEELLEPIRRWLIQNDVEGLRINELYTNYSPDTVEWKQKLGFYYRNIPLSELRKLEKYAQDLIDKGEVINNSSLWGKGYSEYLVNGYDIDPLIKTIGEGIGRTFADRRIREIAEDMWRDVLDPMGDIFKDAINFEQTKAKNPDNDYLTTPSGINDFYGSIYYVIGDTYVKNMEERTVEVNKRIRAIAEQKGYVLKKKTIIPEQKLQGLNSKLKEMFAVDGLFDFIDKDIDLDYNPTRNRWMYDLVGNAYQRDMVGDAEATKEATKQLVALSNMDVANFEKQMKNFGGKSPMPSIAVTDVNVPHTAFGDLTLVFGRETVDPQADTRNKLFASDAWTTTFPDIEKAGGITYELTREKIPPMVDEIAEKINSMGGYMSPTDKDSLATAIANELMNSSRSDDFYEGYQDAGEMVVENAVERAGLDWNDNEGAYQELQTKIGELIRDNQRRDVIPGRYFGGKVRYEDPVAVDKTAEKIVAELPEKGKQKLIDDGYDEVKIEDNSNSYDFAEGISRDIYDVIETMDDRPNNTPTEAGWVFANKLIEDYGFEKKRAIQFAESLFGDLGTMNPIDWANEVRGWSIPGIEEIGVDERTFERITDSVIDWLRDYAEVFQDGRYPTSESVHTLVLEIYKIYEKEVERYNNERAREGEIIQDAITDESTRMMQGFDFDKVEQNIRKESKKLGGVDRSRPVTAENVLEAMMGNGEEIARRVNTEGTLRDLVGVEGKEFTDIEQVRKKNLAKTTYDDWTGDLDSLDKRYETVIQEISKEFRESNPDIPDNFGNQVVRMEIAESYDPDIETFRENLEEENPMWDIIPDDYLQVIIDCVEMGKQVPVRFSESKPQRLVDLYKEVRYILAPKEDFKKVNEIVKGTPLEGKVHMYDRSGFKAERSDRIKSLQKKYGNIFFNMGGVIMPIAMLLMMINQQEETA